jgi:hypothetical protein
MDGMGEQKQDSYRLTRKEIKRWFPGLTHREFRLTSCEDYGYNCVAWAGGDTGEKWDPDPTIGRFWPEGVPRTLEVESFVKLYEKTGDYQRCDNSSLELGFEKIAIFWNYNPDSGKNEVTHAARQLQTGWWTSKLGDYSDITHKTLAGLEGKWPAYGTACCYLKRAVSGSAASSETDTARHPQT